MACRLPVVATRWSGNLAFMNDENSLLLDIEGLREIDNRAEFAFYRGHRWAEPSQTHLSEMLVRLSGDPALRKRIGARARSDVERHWQWKHVTQAVADRVEALAKDSGFGATRPAGSGAEPAYVRPLHVNWEGDFYAHHSLAGVNRALATRLAMSGAISVTPLSREAPPFAPDTAVEVERIIRSLPPLASQSKADVVVRLRWPPDLSSTGSTPLVLIQPWEYGGIPSAWIPQIQRHVSEVWCSSTWVKECYVRSGVPESKVAVVPLGVDTDRFTPDGPAFPLATKKSRRLLFVGGTIPRKGIDVLLRSYLDTFSADDDVCLVVKAFGSGHVYKGSTIDDQLRAVAEDPTSAEVELIDDELSEEQVPMLYRSCDVLVHPYRGEGFGLPIAEAMASGLPVIVTGYGACLDFCDEDNALFVPATESPIEMSDVGPSPIGYWWAEPDADALGGILRRVVDEPEVLDGLGAAGRARILVGLHLGRGGGHRGRTPAGSDGPRRHRLTRQTDPGVGRRRRTSQRRSCLRIKAVPSTHLVVSLQRRRRVSGCASAGIAREREARFLEQRRAEHRGLGRDDRPLLLGRRVDDVAEAGGQPRIAEEFEARRDGPGPFDGEALLVAGDEDERARALQAELAQTGRPLQGALERQAPGQRGRRGQHGQAFGRAAFEAGLQDTVGDVLAELQHLGQELRQLIGRQGEGQVLSERPARSRYSTTMPRCESRTPRSASTLSSASAASPERPRAENDSARCWANMVASYSKPSSSNCDWSTTSNRARASSWRPCWRAMLASSTWTSTILSLISRRSSSATSASSNRPRATSASTMVRWARRRVIRFVVDSAPRRQ